MLVSSVIDAEHWPQPRCAVADTRGREFSNQGSIGSSARNFAVVMLQRSAEDMPLFFPSPTSFASDARKTDVAMIPRHEIIPFGLSL